MLGNARFFDRRERTEFAKIREQDLHAKGSLGALHGLSWLPRLKALFFLLLLSPAAVFAQASRAAVAWQPAQLVNGSPVLFQVRVPAGVQSITATWLGHDLTFFHSGSSHTWYALAGIPVEAMAGKYGLKITEAFAAAKSAQWVTMVRVGRAVYPKITVHVAKKYTEPNPEELREINADKEVKQKAFAVATAEKLWTGAFVAPVSSPVSDVFGTARVFNNEVESRHLGLDFAAPAGTPVHAINRGTVILARPLYFEGGFVVIDHGQGLMSLYLHLSDFNVKEGDQVDTGQLIAMSGGSGRATGPHLHLAIRWQGVYVNPAILLKLIIPLQTMLKPCRQDLGLQTS
jgi:murein DD-endopeptidase MepM/ murein hydrolase activator NlpD